MSSVSFWHCKDTARIHHKQEIVWNILQVVTTAALFRDKRQPIPFLVSQNKKKVCVSIEDALDAPIVQVYHTSVYEYEPMVAAEP